MQPLWPHQERGLAETSEAMEADEKRICVTSPTGGGKTRMMLELIGWGFETVLYTNRKMLLEQTAARLTAGGVSFGVRAEGYKPALLERVQLSSIQTEDSRVYQRESWDLHDAKLVLVDEAHAQKGEVAGRVLQDHAENGATIVGFTATPLDLGDIYSRLVTAGTVSELRATSALVPAVHFAPDEPAELLKVNPKKPKSDPVDAELTEKQVIKAMPPVAIFGRVYDHWRKLNPDQRPTILFAPGVKESLWFAEQFMARGVSAAHIDGQDIWINGKFYEAKQDVRDHLRMLAESGRVKVVTNRYVLREGIDWPFLYCGILATAFTSVSAYLQTGGRLLRAAPGKDHCIIIDHGGNWWRHGSLNADREWDLAYTDRIFQAIRKRRLRTKEEIEPFCCSRCYALRTWGRQCPRCGHINHTRSRMVIEKDGTLREVKGDVFNARRVKPKSPLVERKWISCYHRARNSKQGMTFEQAKALFAYEMNWFWPPEDLPFMPTRELDWFRRVSEVPASALRGYAHASQG